MTMQTRNYTGLSVLQAIEQEVAKKLMIAVPVPLVIQWDDKQIGLFKFL